MEMDHTTKSNMKQIKLLIAKLELWFMYKIGWAFYNPNKFNQYFVHLNRCKEKIHRLESC